MREDRRAWYRAGTGEPAPRPLVEAASPGVGPRPKLLAVSCWMPPILTPRSLQVARTLKCLNDTGWQCTVLSVDPQSLRRGAYFVDPSLESIYRNAYQRVRTRSLENMWPFMTLRRLYPRFALPGGTALLGRKMLWAPSAIQA